MKLSIPGVYAAPRSLANNVEKTYFYHRATGVRLPDDPADPAFLDQIVILNRLVERGPKSAKAAAKAMFPSRTKNLAGAAGENEAEPGPQQAPAAADAALQLVGPACSPIEGAPAPRKPGLPDGCFKLLFRRFQASSEFTDLKVQTRGEYARHMRHVEPALAFHPVAAFSADAMDRLITKFHETPTLQKAIRRTMSVVLGYAVRILKWISVNPLYGVQKVRRRGRQEAGVRLPLSEPAIVRFRAANPYGSRARLVFELGLVTAFRREDLALVPAEDIEAGEILLRTGKAGTVVISGITEHLLVAFRTFRAQHPQHARAFYALGAQENGRPVHKRTISADFEAAAVAAKFGKYERVHALRYTAATRLFELGMHYEDIAEVTGHAMAAMARHYCKRRRDAASRTKMLSAYSETPHLPPVTHSEPAPGDATNGAEPPASASDRKHPKPPAGARARKVAVHRPAGAPGSRNVKSASRAPVVLAVAADGQPLEPVKSSPRSGLASRPHLRSGRRGTLRKGSAAREDPG